MRGIAADSLALPQDASTVAVGVQMWVPPKYAVSGLRIQNFFGLSPKNSPCVKKCLTFSRQSCEKWGEIFTKGFA